MNILIKLNGINKYYPVGREKFHALKDINLNIEKGEFVSIEGPSGAGKSTLLHILGLLDKYDNGSYTLNDKDVSKLNDSSSARLRNSDIGFVLQDFSLINQKGVLYNVMLPLLFSKVPFRKIRKMAQDALAKVGIADQAYKRVNQLSGGQRQRVALARALVTSPSFILADEPTGSLDTKNSEQIMCLLKDINKKDNITVIIVTHNSNITEYCRRKIYMMDGEIVSDEQITD